MSILNRLTGGHLDDAALAEIWTAGTVGSSEVITDAHLERCAECRVRFAALAEWMEDIRREAVLEAEEAFPVERLAAQQAQILKRIAASERPARVIAFPTHSGGDVNRRFSAHRWIAAAAAAGLIVGLGIGQLMDLRHLGNQIRPENRVASTPAPELVSRGLTAANASLSEEALLQELEAVATPQYDALRAFDTFTPRAADYVNPR